MIRNTFDLFKEPFDKANINRDHALNLDSSLAAVTARFQYIAQIVASVVSVPFLILAGLFDVLSCKGNLLNIPKAVFIQLFITLPLSILSAIGPLSWSRGLDKSLANYTYEKRVNDYMKECLPYLEVLLRQVITNSRGQFTIEQEDLEKAKLKKETSLRDAAQTTSLRKIQANLAKAPVGSPKHADLYEMLKIKERNLNTDAAKTFDQIRAILAAAEPETSTYQHWSEVLARKYANEPQTIAELNALLNAGRLLQAEPNPANHPAILAAAAPLPQEAITAAANPSEQAAITLAIVEKYVRRHTLEQLRELHLAAHNPETEVPIEAAIEKKRRTITQWATCEKREALANPLGNNNPIIIDLYRLARAEKDARLDQLATQPLEELLNSLANSKNPVEQSDLSEAIIRNYYFNNSYYELHRLWGQAPAPKDSLITAALNRKNTDVECQVRDNTTEDLERMLEATAPVPPEQATLEHKDYMEIVRRKYILEKTLFELEVEAPLANGEAGPHQTIKDAVRDAIVRKKQTIQNLVKSKRLAELNLELAAQQGNEIQRELLAAARDQKQAEINHICQTLTYEQMEAQYEHTPQNSPRKRNLFEAIEKKNAELTLLLNNNTIEQLRAQLSAIPVDQPIRKKDVTFVINHKIADQKRAEAALRAAAAQ